MWFQRVEWKVFPSFILLLFLSACGAPKAADNPGEPQDQNSETQYCNQIKTYSASSAATITGRGIYYYRAVSPGNGLSGSVTADNIPYAEIRVTSSSGSTVQCGTTLADGTFSLRVPAAGSYTVTIYSRSETPQVKATINADYYENKPHSISKTATVGAGATSNIGDISAFARTSQSAKIEGGAFNILAQIYKANVFLRAQLNNNNFVAPKVKVYWRMGFNPYTYFGYSALLSFYRPGTSELFILGGSQGYVHNVDTDHFDNSVVLHEYGHFLEDVYSVSDSPGGSHDGKSIIDPRLAWSEGWANFFQAAVLRSGDPSWRNYVDTIGHQYDSVDNKGTGYSRANISLTEGGAGATYDAVSEDGEGTFREMSISRYLFKTVHTAGVRFENLWYAFSTATDVSTTSGFASPSVAFRNIGLFNLYLQHWITKLQPEKQADWELYLGYEKQNADPRNYAAPLSVASSCADKQMSPVIDNAYNESNLLRSNHFYRFDHDGGSKKIRMIYTGGSNTSSSKRDLDLHLYKEDYVYQESSDSSNGTMVRSSAAAYPADQGDEEVNLAGLPAGRYLLNVKAKTYGLTTSQLSGTLSYHLKLITGTESYLCPSH
ncbi:MAG: carboxypeptidase regulatory-like domain-containing protein [Bdellovibrionaceae bacterium]|nr:carboxypeptidase regulatory-like domain-containing protein [Pseudobdellovibrionaceae bacterium]